MAVMTSIQTCPTWSQLLIPQLRKSTIIVLVQSIENGMSWP